MRLVNKIKTIRGKNLSNGKAKEIDKIFQKEFPGNEPVNPKRPKLFSNDIFFIVEDSKNKILSVGRLKPIKIKFLGITYKIQRIADVVSVMKRKGYGKIVMTAMRKYLDKTNQTGIGFCRRTNSIFYKKCGFIIAKKLAKRFLYKNPKGQLIKNKGDDDVIYFDEKNNFVEKVLYYPKEKVIIPGKHW